MIDKKRLLEKYLSWTTIIFTSLVLLFTATTRIYKDIPASKFRKTSIYTYLKKVTPEKINTFAILHERKHREYTVGLFMERFRLNYYDFNLNQKNQLLTAQTEYMRNIYKNEYKPLMIAVAETVHDYGVLKRGVKSEYLVYLVEEESHFSIWSYSYAGARGLTQVMYSTGKAVANSIGIKWRGKWTLYDPIQNIKIGATHLSNIDNYFDNMEDVICAYNYGVNGWKRVLRRNPNATILYAQNIEYKVRTTLKGKIIVPAVMLAYMHRNQNTKNM